MPSREQIALDVDKVMRGVITAETPVTNEDPDVSNRGFRYSLVPSKAPFDGWGSDLGAWDAIMVKIVAGLVALRPEYQGLKVSPTESMSLLNKPLSDTRDLLISKLVKIGGGND